MDATAFASAPNPSHAPSSSSSLSASYSRVLRFSVRDPWRRRRGQRLPLHALRSQRPEPAPASASHHDVVVVGAGIIGLSIARHLLLHTPLSVAVADAAVPCTGATGAGTLSARACAWGELGNMASRVLMSRWCVRSRRAGIPMDVTPDARE
ncbi:Os09g0514100 [Oryza sativa Japonica Group]|uniref:FAD-dependent oxidoreductase domain-containing protein 1 n=1 Tax=Oryza sativa subsp. japonica TaxID=39947 RepID=A0A0P0XNZ1_ORYSJ|nr:hypothetical protein EE612_048910 [Oryza sativa]BAT08941.1 Os09g0514100 [Oryza sativa Japonica Group]